MSDPPVHPLKLLSLLLQYPQPQLVEVAGAVEPADLGGLGRHAGAVGSLVERLRATPLERLQREYVETFDFARRCSLHLTYHLHGDSRQRGLALVRIKQAYADGGFEVADGELPDYLPMMLEFAALAPEPGAALLGEHRVSIEVVREGLREVESPYLAALDAIAERLGGLSRAQLSRLRRLAAEGPPSERVGLEPFAPPEVMPDPDQPDAARPMVGGLW